jgi:hypothetical protein
LCLTSSATRSTADARVSPAPPDGRLRTRAAPNNARLRKDGATAPPPSLSVGGDPTSPPHPRLPLRCSPRTPCCTTFGRPQSDHDPLVDLLELRPVGRLDVRSAMGVLVSVAEAGGPDRGPARPDRRRPRTRPLRPRQCARPARPAPRPLRDRQRGHAQDPEQGHLHPPLRRHHRPPAHAVAAAVSEPYASLVLGHPPPGAHRCVRGLPAVLAGP